MPSLKHIHTYVRYQGLNKKPIRQAGQLLYKCADPLCTHFAPYSMVIGKMSICSEDKCINQFVLTNRHLERVKPKCLSHSSTREAREYQHAKELANKYLSNLGDQG